MLQNKMQIMWLLIGIITDHHASFTYLFAYNYSPYRDYGLSFHSPLLNDDILTIDQRDSLFDICSFLFVWQR